MKNIHQKYEIEQFVNKYLNSEFERIQKYSYIDLKIKPTEQQCIKEWDTLVNSDKNWTYSNIVKRFHSSILLANKAGDMSPYNRWELIKSDIQQFRKLFENRLKYNKTFITNGLPKDGIIPLHIYAQGINVMRWSPEVSYFKPSTARNIIKDHLNEYDIIFDPFSGYSGRMLGTLACDKKYCGNDISNLVINESNEIYKWLSSMYKLPDVYMSCADVHTYTGTFPCLFTCPPYGDIEQWPGVEKTNTTCDEWIDVCLNNFTCDTYVFVTDDKISKWKTHIVGTIENKSHFGTNIEYIVKIYR